MLARNRKTGAAILGTLEELPGRADIQTDSWNKDADGKLTFDYNDYTEVFWNGQQTVRVSDERGRRSPIFVDEDGNEVTEKDIELHAEGDAFTPAGEENPEAGGRNAGESAAGEVIKCCNCGAAVRPREAESFDGLPLSESARLGHRDTAICDAVNRVTSIEIAAAIDQLEEAGLWETVRGGRAGHDAR